MATENISIDDYEAAIENIKQENPEALIINCEDPNMQSNLTHCFFCPKGEYLSLESGKCEPCDGRIDEKTKICLHK